MTESLIFPVRYDSRLVERLVVLANDSDDWLPKWNRHGRPVGIVYPVHPSGVFPAVDKATAAVEDSMMYVRALIEHPVLQIGTETINLLMNHSRKRKTTWIVSSVGNFLNDVVSLEELTEFLHDYQKPARLVLIKFKKDLSKKVWLVVDMLKWHKRPHLVVRKSGSSANVGSG